MDLIKKLLELEERIGVLERRQNRDSKDQWQYLADLHAQSIHPVTGSIKPKEAQELLILKLCDRDRGC